MNFRPPEDTPAENAIPRTRRVNDQRRFILPRSASVCDSVCHIVVLRTRRIQISSSSRYETPCETIDPRSKVPRICSRFHGSQTQRIVLYSLISLPRVFIRRVRMGKHSSGRHFGRSRFRHRAEHGNEIRILFYVYFMYILPHVLRGTFNSSRLYRFQYQSRN